MDVPITLDGSRFDAALAGPRRHRLLVDGAWRGAADGRTLSRPSPAHGVADYTEEKTLQLHCGPRSTWWLPQGAAASH